MDQPTIVVVGSINADHLVGVPRLPSPGTTVLASGLDYHSGDVTKHASVLEEASVAIVQCEIPVPVLAEVADVCVRHGGAVVALDEAARVAVQAGAIAVTRPGARTGFRPARS